MMAFIVRSDGTACTAPGFLILALYDGQIRRLRRSMRLAQEAADRLEVPHNTMAASVRLTFLSESMLRGLWLLVQSSFYCPGYGQLFGSLKARETKSRSAHAAPCPAKMPLVSRPRSMSFGVGGAPRQPIRAANASSPRTGGSSRRD